MTLAVPRRRRPNTTGQRKTKNSAFAVGLDETVYPGITSCKGEKSLEPKAVLPLLNPPAVLQTWCYVARRCRFSLCQS